MLKKNGIIKNLDGIVISDPYYRPGVWCRYESDAKFKDWAYKYSSKVVTDDEYPDWPSIEFKMIMGQPDMVKHITFKDEYVTYPSSLAMKEYTIGMDTACFCCGSKANYEAYGESMAIHTGTDGQLGNVFEFSPEGSSKPCAIVFVGGIDGGLISEQELFSNIASGFGAREIEIEKNGLEEMLKVVRGQKEDVLTRLINIGFGRKADVKPTVWNYANKIMEELEKEGLVKPFDFGRGKGKWDIANKYSELSIKELTDIARGKMNDEMLGIISGYERYCEKTKRREEKGK